MSTGGVSAAWWTRSATIGRSAGRWVRGRPGPDRQLSLAAPRPALSKSALAGLSLRLEARPDDEQGGDGAASAPAVQRAGLMASLTKGVEPQQRNIDCDYGRFVDDLVQCH